MKPKRKITKIDFNREGSHLALTDESQGFSCAGVNEDDKPFLIKSREEAIKALSPNQKEICEQLGVDTSLAIKNKSESEDSLDGSQHTDTLDNKTTKDEDNMSDEIQKALEAEKARNDELQARLEKMEKANQKNDAEKSIAGFGFEAELKEEVSEALAGFEGASVMIKAFEALVEAGKEAVEVEKSAKDSASATKLAAALEQEVGTDEEAEAPAEEDENTLIAKALKAVNENK